jgi:hypothetical protein
MADPRSLFMDSTIQNTDLFPSRLQIAPPHDYEGRRDAAINRRVRHRLVLTTSFAW